MDFASLSLVLLSTLVQATPVPNAPLATCTATLTASTPVVSVTTGGTQWLTLRSTSTQRWFSIVGTFSSGPAEPYFTTAGLHLARDRYLLLSYLGRSPLLPGGIPFAPGGHQVLTDSQGIALQAVVVPPGQWPFLAGQTVRHAAYSLSESLLPECGSNVVSLTFVP